MRDIPRQSEAKNALLINSYVCGNCAEEFSLEEDEKTRILELSKEDLNEAVLLCDDCGEMIENWRK